MKKILTIFLVLTISTASLSGCQATPKEPVVGQKDMEQMIEKAKSIPEASDAPAETLAQRMGAPAHYADQFTNSKGNLTVRANADVSVPDGDVIKVLEVGQSPFTQDTVDALIKSLIHGQLYECGADGLPYSMEAIQNRIVAYQAILSQGAPNGSADSTRRMIATLQKEYETAPENSVPVSGKLEQPTHTDPNGKTIKAEGAEAIKGIAVSDKGYETLYMLNNGYNTFICYVREPKAAVSIFTGIGNYITSDKATNNDKGVMFTADDIKAIPDIALTKENAVKQGDALVKSLEGDFICCSAGKVYGGSYDEAWGGYGHVNPLRCVWRLRYARVVNGIPVTYTDEDCTSAVDETQAAPWPYEGMTVYANDNGVVGFEWRSLYQATGTSVENATVLPFDRITDVFKAMIGVKNSWVADGGHGEINITGIKFGLTRVTEQNKRDRGILIPAWDFFGTMAWDWKGSTNMKDAPERSLLTVNAIDGSIIDRSLGY